MSAGKTSGPFVGTYFGKWWGNEPPPKEDSDVPNRANATQGDASHFYSTGSYCIDVQSYGLVSEDRGRPRRRGEDEMQGSNLNPDASFTANDVFRTFQGV